jgi:hypothetical protein
MAGTTTAQGYGWPHQRERRRWVKHQREGGDEERDGRRRGRLRCRADQCLGPTRWIEQGEAWDLGHHGGQRGWRGPEHVTCNRTDGARKSNRTGNPGARGRRPRRRRRVGLAEVSVDVTDL